MKIFRSFFIFSAFLILLGACEEDVGNQIADLEAFVSKNPVHKKLFSGFEQIHEERGWHPNLDFIIYRSFK